MNLVWYGLRQATLLLATLYASSALGVVVMVTDPGFPGGANNVSRDLATGLDWLDWTASTNHSFDEMTTLLGTTYMGWSHASQDQVLTLFSNFGLSTTNYPNPTFLNDGGASAASFFAFLGTTNSGPGFTLGATSFVPSVGAHRFATVTGPPNPTNSTTSSVDFLDSNSVAGNVGHALVRATVPEPSSFMLSLLGICMGALAARKKSLAQRDRNSANHS